MCNKTQTEVLLKLLDLLGFLNGRVCETMLCAFSRRGRAKQSNLFIHLATYLVVMFLLIG